MPNTTLKFNERHAIIQELKKKLFTGGVLTSMGKAKILEEISTYLGNTHGEDRDQAGELPMIEKRFSGNDVLTGIENGLDGAIQHHSFDGEITQKLRQDVAGFLLAYIDVASDES